MDKLKFVLPVLVLGVLVLVGIVFSLDKFAEAEEETYDTCVQLCGVKHDRVSCVRKCEIDNKSCLLGCGDCCFTEECTECKVACTEELWMGVDTCIDRCNEAHNHTLLEKFNPYAPQVAWWSGFEFWESGCDIGNITRPYDYSGCVAECKEYFDIKAPIGEEEEEEEEPVIISLKEVWAFATSTGITGTIYWIAGPIVLLIIIGIVVYFLLKKRKTPKI